MGIDGEKDSLKRRRLIQANVADLASAGISLNEMSEAVGLKARARRDFVRQMTGRLLEPPEDGTDKKQSLFDAVHAYANIGLDRTVMSDAAARADVSTADVMDACRRAKDFYRR